MYFAGRFFESEPLGDDHIWRYMDFPRFVSLLDANALFFGSASRMQDPWEGAFGAGSSVDPRYVEQLKSLRIADQMHMTCWSVGEVESAALWDLYQPDGKGVAIKSTWGRLTSSISARPYLVGGSVAYIDHSVTDIDATNIFKTYVYKRRQFEYEHEARVLYYPNHVERAGRLITRPDGTRPAPGKDPAGVLIPVQVAKLVETVYVSPRAQPWVSELVRSIIVKYGHNFDVIDSDLYMVPK